MALPDPQDLLKGLDATLTRMRTGPATLEPGERKRIRENLEDVYNYVSESSQRRSLINTLYATSARDAQLRKEMEEERRTLDAHRHFVEQNFDKADQYLRAVQTGGYAVFFAVWGLMREALDPLWGLVAVILMVVSAGTFVLWEVGRSTLLTLALHRHATISAGTLEEFLRSRKFVHGWSTVVPLAKARAWVWLGCVLTGVPSLVILLWQLGGALVGEFHTAVGW
jgi:hypothetical protein